jgi:hypothetical protein
MRCRTTKSTKITLILREITRKRVGTIFQKKIGDGGNQNSFAQRPKDNLICHCCGKKGHSAPDCTLDKKPAAGRGKKEWSGFQREAGQCFNTGDIDSCFHDDLKDVIILDTGSTIGGTFMNPKLLSDITTTGKPLEMVTNAGPKRMFKTGVIEGFGKAWFNPTQVANIFGFSKLEDQFRITYDSSVEHAFNVHTNNGIVKFIRNKDGLYVYRPSQNYLDEIADEEVDSEDQHGFSEENVPCDGENGESFLVDSVEENKIGYTKREFESAKQARKLYHTLGCPTVANFKHILRQNIIKNCPVTIGDISTAERIFGPDIGTLKGKSTRKVPVAVRTDEIDIPQELKDMHKDLTLCIDIMFINGMPMLTSIDRSIRFRALIALDNRSATAIFDGINSIYRI